MMESHTVALKPYFIAAVARISTDTHTHNLSSACKQGRAGDHSKGRLYLRRACASRVTVLGRCVSVSVCPFQFSATRRNNIVKSLHQRVRRYICLIFKSADFRINTAFKVMASQANMLISTGLPQPGALALCILKAQDTMITTKGVYRISYTI